MKLIMENWRSWLNEAEEAQKAVTPSDAKLAVNSLEKLKLTPEQLEQLFKALTGDNAQLEEGLGDAAKKIIAQVGRGAATVAIAAMLSAIPGGPSDAVAAEVDQALSPTSVTTQVKNIAQYATSPEEADSNYDLSKSTITSTKTDGSTRIHAITHGLLGDFVYTQDVYAGAGIEGPANNTMTLKRLGSKKTVTVIQGSGDQPTILIGPEAKKGKKLKVGSPEYLNQLASVQQVQSLINKKYSEREAKE